MGNTLEAQLQAEARLTVGAAVLTVSDVLAWEPADRTVGIMCDFLAVEASDSNSYALHDDGTVHALDDDELEYVDEPEGEGVGTWNAELVYGEHGVPS